MPISIEDIGHLLGDDEPAPNRFTLGVGKLVRKARTSAGLSQSELGRRINRRKATISDIETGKSEVGLVTLAMISAALEKPIISFFPDKVRDELMPHKTLSDEAELLIHFRKIEDIRLRKLAIRQIKLLSDAEDG